MRKWSRGNVLRAQTGLMVAFYALAMFRGLIPGLCATLAEVDAPHAEIQISAGCCSDAADTAPGSASESAHCAFCSLLTTTAHAVEIPTVPPAIFVEQPVRLAGQSAPDLAIARDPILRRGPPALA